MKGHVCRWVAEAVDEWVTSDIAPEGPGLAVMGNDNVKSDGTDTDALRRDTSHIQGVQK